MPNPPMSNKRPAACGMIVGDGGLTRPADAGWVDIWIDMTHISSMSERPRSLINAQSCAYVNISDQMSSPKEKKPRGYQLRARADKQAATHRALAKAAFELHSSVGPAKTTISAIAERAGV